MCWHMGRVGAWAMVFSYFVGLHLFRFARVDGERFALGGWVLDEAQEMKDPSELLVYVGFVECYIFCYGTGGRGEWASDEGGLDSIAIVVVVRTIGLGDHGYGDLRAWRELLEGWLLLCLLRQTIDAEWCNWCHGKRGSGSNFGKQLGGH